MQQLHTPRQPRRTRQHWSAIVQRHEHSGLTAKAFCEQQQLSYASFIKWRAELADDKRAERGSFVELTADDDRDAPAGASGCLIELSIARTVVLRIHAA